MTLGDVNEAILASLQALRISMKIVAHTSFTSQQSVSPTLNDSNTNLSILKEVPETFTQKFKLPNYTPTATTWLPNYSNDTYAAHFDVPFVLPAVRQLVPSFESCLISRSYTLSVTIHFKHGDSWSIEVPINLVRVLTATPLPPTARLLALTLFLLLLTQMTHLKFQTALLCSYSARCKNRILSVRMKMLCQTNYFHAQLAYHEMSLFYLSLSFSFFSFNSFFCSLFDI